MIDMLNQVLGEALPRERASRANHMGNNPPLKQKLPMRLTLEDFMPDDYEQFICVAEHMPAEDADGS